MRYAFAVIFMMTITAQADETAPVVNPKPDTVITITLAELKTITDAAVARAMSAKADAEARIAFEKIDGEIKAAQPKAVKKEGVILTPQRQPKK